jgi:biopolymer transport protein ExbB/TolQ
MKKNFSTEFVFQVFALLIAFIVVHAVYVAVIRPNAEAFLQQEQARMQADPDYIQQRNFYVVVRDYEQEACFVLMFWAISILGYKAVEVGRQRKMLELDLLQVPDEVPIRADAVLPIIRRLEDLPEQMSETLLPRALLTALQRFDATGNVQNVSTATREVCDSEGERMESELSIIRYIAWAIPSVGFIGTVRGIGDALAQAHRAVEGDITGVTQSLGVAFNSTFIALVISIVLMFFIHQLQLVQERLVLDTESYCDRRLIRRLKKN